MILSLNLLVCLLVMYLSVAQLLIRFPEVQVYSYVIILNTGRGKSVGIINVYQSGVQVPAGIELLFDSVCAVL